jgi:flagellar biosynthesis protein FlhF
MQYFTIQARSQGEALEKMRSQYGPAARVLSHRSIRIGRVLGLFAREGVEITGYFAGEEKRRDVEGEKRRILETARREQAMQLILEELKSLKKDLQAAPQGGPPAGSPAGGQAAQGHPALARVRDLLGANDFPPAFIEGIVARIGREFSLEDLGDHAAVERAVLEYIGDGVRIWRSPVPSEGPLIVTVVGPTGVGKTTTIAKLAAMYSFARDGGGTRRVKMVTIDNYKIAARKQIETYAEIMQLPAAFAESREELEKVISVSQDVDIILVDTIGQSPGDFQKLGEIKDILDACGSRNEVHLAISATTKGSDVEEILRQFEPFRYKAVVVTKLDETSRAGNILGPLIERQKPISYITDGQLVPQDLEAATVSRLLRGLDGFRIDRERLEQRYAETSKARSA